MGHNTTERVWRRDYARVHASIPAEWIWTDPSDGWQGIAPEHADHPLARYYRSLQLVGYARGWL